MGNIKERLQGLKDRFITRALGYVNIPISDEEKATYGNFQAYMPIKDAPKFGLEDSREIDTLDYAASVIKFYKREKPKFDGIILDSGHHTVSDAEKAMDYIAKKYNLSVIARLNGRFSVKNPHQQISQTRETR